MMGIGFGELLIFGLAVSVVVGVPVFAYRLGFRRGLSEGELRVRREMNR